MTAIQAIVQQVSIGFGSYGVPVAFSPDGGTALVTSSGTDRVAVIDVEKLLTLVRGATDEERREVLPNHLGQSPAFVVDHLPTRNSPRGVAFAPDGQTAWVANALDAAMITDLDAATFAPYFHPSGDKIIFVSDKTGEEQYYAVDQRGGDWQQLTDGFYGFTLPPVFSPDGNTLASSDAHGDVRLWRAIPGT